ncbi:uncharacterized protein ARMOST_12847 [Armillaria ostoyae]|uniref:Uncharacterized protein n=1 Tax=Armillaria ostoyae TaxID=47428 RepID=A0A284RL48_ARMOS|nr:uncharacterized protein ARMOST_12847 [Armillaria ostoyae]
MVDSTMMTSAQQQDYRRNPRNFQDEHGHQVTRDAVPTMPVGDPIESTGTGYGNTAEAATLSQASRQPVSAYKGNGQTATGKISNSERVERGREKKASTSVERISVSYVDRQMEI